MVDSLIQLQSTQVSWVRPYIAGSCSPRLRCIKMRDNTLHHVGSYDIFNHITIELKLKQKTRSKVYVYLGTSFPHAFATKTSPETALLAADAFLDRELSLQA